MRFNNLGWRWFQRFRLPFGINANMSRNGLGWSWGFGFIRWGVSPLGRKWVSIGIPGTGFRFYRNVEVFPFENLFQRLNRKTKTNIQAESVVGSNRKKYPKLKPKPNMPSSNENEQKVHGRYPKLKKKK